MALDPLNRIKPGTKLWFDPTPWAGRSELVEAVGVGDRTGQVKTATGEVITVRRAHLFPVKQ